MANERAWPKFKFGMTLLANRTRVQNLNWRKSSIISRVLRRLKLSYCNILLRWRMCVVFIQGNKNLIHCNDERFAALWIVCWTPPSYFIVSCRSSRWLVRVFIYPDQKFASLRAYEFHWNNIKGLYSAFPHLIWSMLRLSAFSIAVLRLYLVSITDTTEVIRVGMGPHQPVRLSWYTHTSRKKAT